MGKQVPLVTIVVPIYNVEKYLSVCLDSILSQEGIEYEVICIEDCSIDSSREILQKYAKEDNRIRVIYHDKNKGLSVARNEGICGARGKYIWFVDSDDFIVENALKKLYNYAESCNIDMLSFGMECIYENDELRKKYQVDTERYCKYHNDYGNVYRGQEIMAQLIKNSEFNNGCVPRYLFRREFLIEEKLFFKENLLFEDNLYMSICFLKAKRVKCINESFYYRLKRENSITTSETEISKAKSLFISYVELWKIVMNSKLDDAGDFAFEEIFCNWREIIKSVVRKNRIEVERKNLLEKCLWQLICDDTIQTSVSIYMKKFIVSPRKTQLYIYGAGKLADEVFRGINELDIPINGVIVTEKKENRKSIWGHPIKEIIEVEKNEQDMTILIAVAGEEGRSIKEALKKKGIESVYVVEFER